MAKDKNIIETLNRITKLYKRKGTDRVLVFTAGRDLRKIIGKEKPEALIVGAKIFIVIEKSKPLPVMKKEG